MLRAQTIDELRAALDAAQAPTAPVAVYIEVDRYEGVPDYECWWDVPVAEVADDDAVHAAREEYEQGRRRRSARYLEQPP